MKFFIPIARGKGIPRVSARIDGHPRQRRAVLEADVDGSAFPFFSRNRCSRLLGIRLHGDDRDQRIDLLSFDSL